MTHKFLLVLTLMAVTALGAFATPLQISSTGSSLINFDGAGNFSFVPGDGIDSFVFTNGGCIGCFGHIDGSFSIGTISGDGAEVSGTGALTITDLNNDVLTGQVSFLGLATTPFPAPLTGSIGGVQGTMYAAGLSYSGSDPGLLSLIYGATVTISFQDSAALTPTYLANNQFGSSFSGAFDPSPIPEPGTYALMGLGLTGLALIRRRRTARK